MNFLLDNDWSKVSWSGVKIYVGLTHKACLQIISLLEEERALLERNTVYAQQHLLKNVIVALKCFYLEARIFEKEVIKATRKVDYKERKEKLKELREEEIIEFIKNNREFCQGLFENGPTHDYEYGLS